MQVPGARALHGHNVCATQRFGGARDAEVVRAELRFYARRLGADAAARYRTLAQWKFGLKRQWHRLRGQAEAAAGCAAILAACRESAGDHG